MVGLKLVRVSWLGRSLWLGQSWAVWRLAHLPHIEWQHRPQPRLRWRGVKEYREQHECCVTSEWVEARRQIGIQPWYCALQQA